MLEGFESLRNMMELMDATEKANKLAKAGDIAGAQAIRKDLLRKQLAGKTAEYREALAASAVLDCMGNLGPAAEDLGDPDFLRGVVSGLLTAALSTQMMFYDITDEQAAAMSPNGGRAVLDDVMKVLEVRSDVHMKSLGFSKKTFDNVP